MRTWPPPLALLRTWRPSTKCPAPAGISATRSKAPDPKISNKRRRASLDLWIPMTANTPAGTTAALEEAQTSTGDRTTRWQVDSKPEKKIKIIFCFFNNNKLWCFIVLLLFSNMGVLELVLLKVGQIISLQGYFYMPCINHDGLGIP